MKLIIRFIILLLIFHINKIIAQPCTTVKEYNRKRHTVYVGDTGLNTYGHPYTMFDKHNGFTFQKTIEKIRERIKNENDPDNEGSVFRAYHLLYTFASSAMPTDTDMHNEAASGLALWAKNNAFVMLIGLNGNEDTPRYRTNLFAW